MSRSALAIGTVGRIGEELLNTLLESAAYRSVSVAVEAPLQSMMPRLRPWQIGAAVLDGVAEAALANVSMPHVDDVFCCISDSRSHFKRDQAYVSVRAEQISALARLAVGQGAKRFVLLSPLSAFLQLSAAHDSVISLNEAALASMAFETIIIMRPTAEHAIAGSGWLERLIGWGAKAIMEIITPQRLQPLRARQIAQAAVNAAQTLGPGLHVVTGQQIRELALESGDR
ncbi:MAG: hypothetical protein ABI612_09370 [Betaproteobacteria bacterium]